jgi:FkbM family methyltransferase
MIMQRLEVFRPPQFSHREIAQSHEGWSYSPTDTHFGIWIREAHDICHDTGFLEWINPYIGVGSTVFDIGANIGTHSIGYLRSPKQIRHLIAVEPVFDSFECLRRNVLYQIKIGSGWVEDITLICAGLSDSAKLSAVARETENHGASFISAHGDQPIDLMRMDKILKDPWLTKISLIKIDTEGHELKVLKGAGEILSRNGGLIYGRPWIVLEINHGALNRMGTCQEEIFDYLKEIGYRKHAVYPTELPAKSDKELLDMPQYDAAFMPI